MTAHTAPFDVAIHDGSASINGTPLGSSGPASQFHAIFGIPDRIVDASSTPAPLDHRNNQFHYFDAQGVTLNEHHYTHQIQAINFVLDTNLSHHPTKHAFRGAINVGSLQIVIGTLERRLSVSDLTFTAQLPGTWFAKVRSSVDGQTITVAVSTKGPKMASGKRSKTRVITSVSLCLAHDPWDTTYIPKQSSLKFGSI